MPGLTSWLSWKTLPTKVSLLGERSANLLTSILDFDPEGYGDNLDDTDGASSTSETADPTEHYVDVG